MNFEKLRKRLLVYKCLIEKIHLATLIYINLFKTKNNIYFQ